ncbi:MAG: hypothetical protein P1V35_11075 [Planctomycetota bacterium]|nr:hypothetical protein [Planctomycetota bacterium]
MKLQKRLGLSAALAWMCAMIVGALYSAEPGIAWEGPVQEAKGYSDKQLQAAWDSLDADDKRRASEWFSQEAKRLPCFQNTLISFLKGSLEKDPYDWPEAEAGPTFDPETHAPAQPIPRVPQAKDSSEYKSVWKSLVGWMPERRLNSAWSYNYATQSVERVGDPGDPERIFQNGLAGFPPDLDLAEAICQSLLDDGSLVETHRAFAHTYAVRSGHSFPGITLYDAWSSGRKIEMPDVECLGLLHTLENDWKSFKAPVRKQDALYRRIEALYVPVQRQRALQEAMARCYLIGTPVLAAGYGGTEDFLSDVWEQNASTPGQVKEALPNSKGWKKWMEKGQKTLRSKKKRREAAQNRRAYLAQGERAVRGLWIYVLQGMEALPAK